MRIVKKEELKGHNGEKGSTARPGYEDLILALIVIVLIVGYARGQLTIQDFLTYLGVSGAGGLWGMLGGTLSSKT
jgi:hypothetical protein